MIRPFLLSDINASGAMKATTDFFLTNSAAAAIVDGSSPGGLSSHPIIRLADNYFRYAFNRRSA